MLFSQVSGWATIKLKNFKGSRLSKRTKKKSGLETYDCEAVPLFDACDPYVKITVDGKNVLTTETAFGTTDYNVNENYYTPNMIKKNTTITIEVLDDDTDDGKDRNADNSEPMLLASGTVESFMQEPIRCIKSRVVEKSSLGGEETLPPTCIEVDIIWQDHRE